MPFTDFLRAMLPLLFLHPLCVAAPSTAMPQDPAE